MKFSGVMTEWKMLLSGLKNNVFEKIFYLARKKISLLNAQPDIMSSYPNKRLSTAIYVLDWLLQINHIPLLQKMGIWQVL